jgi:hypothetical protein
MIGVDEIFNLYKKTDSKEIERLLFNQEIDNPVKFHIALTELKGRLFAFDYEYLISVLYDKKERAKK